jgi:hypothetical protein
MCWLVYRLTTINISNMSRYFQTLRFFWIGYWSKLRNVNLNFTYVQYLQKPVFMRLTFKLNLILMVQATYKWSDENYGLSKARRNILRYSAVRLKWRCLFYRVGETSRKLYVTSEKYTLVSGQLYLIEQTLCGSLLNQTSS